MLHFSYCPRQSEAEEKVLSKKLRGSMLKKVNARRKTAKIEPALDEQFMAGRLLGKARLTRPLINC